ncbi:MAG: terminase small subunit [Maricaulis sp.]|nr:terminase small subunit [Maricaulis sp.]
MTALDNPRHERFAQELATGLPQTTAYVRAGYRPDRRHASRLASNGDIQARVEGFQEEAALQTGVTIETVNEKLETAFLAAQAMGNASAMTAAAMAQAKLHGLIGRGRKLSTASGETPDFTVDFLDTDEHAR